jgi:hemoglobin/transferrin/lactoferrin receptor protein
LKSSFPVALLLILIPGSHTAVAASPQLDPASLERVVVVSSRSPRPVSEVVGMVLVLDHTDIETSMAASEEGLWRYAPGIQVESSGGRFSAHSLNIRGIGGNRIVMEIDGIPVQERFAVGTMSFAGRSGADPDFIRRIEVLRGPASSLYGARAIGGVVSVSTFDPEDLAGTGFPGALLRGAYSGERDSTGGSVIGAWHGDSVGFLLGGSHRQDHEADRSAASDHPDRQDRERAAMLAKLTLADGGSRRARLTLEASRDETLTDMNSLLGHARFANTTQLSGDDRVTRAGLALDGHIDHGALRIEGATFHRETRTRQDTVDLRERLPRPVRIDREFAYDTTISGVRSRVSRTFETGGWQHRMLLGVDYARSRLDESRDALQTGILDGQSSNVVLGERFPLRDFPLTVNQETGVYLQDEIDSIAGHWTVIPSVRLDRTRTRVRDDAAWRQANPRAELAEQNVTDTSPRLGVLWRPSRDFQAWGQVASGFRAPPAEDLNIGLDLPLFNTRALPNPDLESESSLGWELGMRLNKGGAWFSAAAFWTDYEDFIVSMMPLGRDPETGTLLFQSRNLDRVRIRGIEFEAGAPLGLLTPSLDAFGAGVTGYWAQGENRRTGAGLDDVGPASAVAYIDWADASGRWELRVSGVFARSKTPEPRTPALFSVPGHGIVDLTSSWRPSDRLTLRAGVFNLGDKTWWRWGEVRGVPAGDPQVAARSAPGRSASVSFSLGIGPGRM